MGKLELGQNDIPEHDVGASAASRWPLVLEHVLEGVTHQLSNRVALLAGVSEILGHDDTIPPILRALADEIPKLEETLRLLRLLTPADDEAEEPAEVAPLVNDAIALAHVHPSVKHVRFQSDVARSIQPVVVRPTHFTRRVLMALVTSADTQGEGAGGAVDDVAPLARTITVTAREDGGEVLVQISGNDGVLETIRAPTLGAARRSS